ncbi:MAG: hypothetical protein HY063_11895 [Bacteroidetes bacterium]|nr:hypothetical protein [Bacteroidota bacterium]
MEDFIVVGSGCTGAMAAQTLVEAGAKVCMLDAGLSEEKYKNSIPDKDFISLRQTEEEQHRYFLGDNFEGVPWGNVTTGAQLTPPRKFVIEKVNELLKFDSSSFFPMESLAYGGLGSTWGVGCNFFSGAELGKCGLEKNKMKDAYQLVASRIGISAEKDDASAYTCGEIQNHFPSIELDSGSKKIYKKYLRKKQQINKEGFYLGKPALALLTNDKNGRKKISYNDMDFYSDREQSAWRPWITIEQLKKQNNFRYIGNQLVLKFSEKEDYIEVECLNISTNEKQIHQCRKLVLASGTLGTARIILRSFQKEAHRLPLLCNPYTYVPSLNWQMLGKEMDRFRTGFAQLVMAYDPQKKNEDVSIASIYTYRSLLLFRIIKEVPFAFQDARIIMQYLLPAITIFGIHHPEEYSPAKKIWLEENKNSPTADSMKAEYIFSEEEKKKIISREKKFTGTMRKLGCIALKKVNPGLGASIHYAGTLPFNENNLLYSLHPSGKLNGAKNIFVADGSGFKYLPAKGLTFSLMANAHNVALNSLA